MSTLADRFARFAGFADLFWVGFLLTDFCLELLSLTD